MNIQHGKYKEHSLKGVTGFLLGLEYTNPRSLGKALSEIKPTIYWVSECGMKSVVWLADVTVLPTNYSERLARLAAFNTEDTGGKCERCKANGTLYQVNVRNGFQLICFACTKFGSQVSAKAIEAESRAVFTIKKRQQEMNRRFRELRAQRKAA